MASLICWKFTTTSIRLPYPRLPYVSDWLTLSFLNSFLSSLVFFCFSEQRVNKHPKESRGKHLRILQSVTLACTLYTLLSCVCILGTSTIVITIRWLKEIQFFFLRVSIHLAKKKKFFFLKLHWPDGQLKNKFIDVSKRFLWPRKKLRKKQW